MHAFAQRLALAALAAALTSSALGGATPEARMPTIPVVDLRVGLAQAEQRDTSLAKGVGQAGYVALAAGGVVAVLVPVAGRFRSGKDDLESRYAALRAALTWSQHFEVGRCGAPGAVATWFELEAPDELAQDPPLVGLWVARGARVFAVVGDHDGDMASSARAQGAGPVAGLTTAGRDVVRQILAAGALVDVSNASELSIDDVLALAKAAHAPVLATHSNARALADDPRNLSDTQIRAIANSGGIIGVTAEHGLLAPGRQASLSHLVRQIMYMARVAGPEHVALGIGFEAGVSPVLDFHDATDFPRLARALRAAGMTQEDVARIFHLNAERLLCPSAATRRAD